MTAPVAGGSCVDGYDRHQPPRHIYPERLLEESVSKNTIDILRALPGLDDPKAEDIDPSDVFSELDRQRESGELNQAITSGSICYGSSRSQAGMLDEVHTDGTVITGIFQEGEFQSKQS